MKETSFTQKLNGAIKYHVVIKKVKSIVDNEFLIITDGQDNHLSVEMYYINSVEINDRCMILKMDNEITIKIDYQDKKQVKKYENVIIL